MVIDISGEIHVFTILAGVGEVGVRMQDGTERNTGVPVMNKVGLSTPKNKEQIHTKVLLAKSYFACLPFQRELCFKSSCLSKVAHSKEMNL